MKKYRTAFLPAIKHVRNCRPNVCPNLGFELQLKHYQQLLGLEDRPLPKTDSYNNNSNHSNNNNPNKKKVNDPLPHSDTKPNIENKPAVEAKQMLLTFNAPDPQPKPHRMSSTAGKSFSTYTPNPVRKGPNHSSQKRGKVEGELQVVGHRASEVKNEMGW
jgi:hypothetical protein